MNLAANFVALAAITLAAGPLHAQDAAKPKPAPAATGSTGPTAAKPKPKPLSIDEIEKLQAAKAAAKASGATGSTGPKPAAPKPASNITGPIAPKPLPPLPSHLAPAATAPKAIAKPVPGPVASPLMAKPAAAATAPAAPAPPATGPLNRTTIVLDPAHGGADSGSRISDNLVEKDVTLQFAFKLRSLLQARGFTVIMTREADPTTTDSNPNPLSLDDRAGVANHARAAACLLLHATASGSGVHLYHSELDPAAGEAASLPWLTAQAAWVSQSSTLAGKLAQSFTRANIPLVSSAASIRPVDSLTCPALVIELAPKAGDASSFTDSSYQQSVAEALAGALVFWKNQVQPPVKLTTDAPTEAR